MNFSNKNSSEKIAIRVFFRLGFFVQFVLLVLFIFSPLFSYRVESAAGVPALINFQGRLMNASGDLLGDPAGTEYCYKFSIWNATTAGSKIWPAGAPATDTILTREGVFDASIGNVDTLDLAFTDDQAYVEVEVATKVGATCAPGDGAETFETLTPRPRIVSSAFAINSRTVGGFTPAQSATDNQLPALTSGVIVLGHATTAGVASTGANPFTIDAGTSGILNLNNTSTGNILLGGGSGSTGCTLTNSTGAFACSAGFTGTGATLTSTNITETTTSSALSLVGNSLTTGTGIYVASSSLSSGSLIDLAITGTAGLTGQKGINVSLSGANGTGAQTTYGLYLSNTHTGTSTNVGLYATASGGSNNLAGNFDAGLVLIGGTTPTSGTLSKLNIVSSMASDGSTTAIAGIHSDYTFNPSAGGTQVGNRFVVNNAPTSTANTSVNQIIRTIDNTSLANTVRGIEVVSNAGSNTAGTNTGIRTTGATFGIQALTSGVAGGVALPAAIYGESTGSTQGDILRLYTTSMTSASQMAHFYHNSSTFTGTGLLMSFATGSGTYTGDFIDLQNNSVTQFRVTSAGVVSMGLSGTASTNAVCSSLANNTAPTANVAYEIRDCSGAPAADYAEMYPVEKGIEFGDIVATGTVLVKTYDVTDGNIDWTKVKGEVTKLVKSNRAYQTNVIGIVSDNYGDFSSTGYNLKEEDNPMPVALSGRVPVKIASSSSAISAGEYITTSSVSGKATKAIKAGFVIGKALEDWSPESGKETVMVFIEQGYYNGQNIRDFTGITLNTGDSELAFEVLGQFLDDNGQSNGNGLDISELLTDRILAGLEIITPRLTARMVTASTLSVSKNTNLAGLTMFERDGDLIGGVTFGVQAEFLIPPVFSKDTAGFAIVKEGDKKVRVDFEEPYMMTPAITIAMTFEATDNIDELSADALFAENIKYIVVEKDTTGFTILLNKNASHNVRFSWIALGVRDAKVFESLGNGLIISSPTPSPSPITADGGTPQDAVAPTPEPNPSPDSSGPSAPEPEIISEPEPTPEVIPEPEPEPTPEPEPITADGGTPQDAVAP